MVMECLSTQTKIDELKRIVDGLQLQIFGVSETFFETTHSASSVSIPGFNLFRNDRLRKRRGGVALYAAKNLTSKCI
jgi:hypothetical protein